MKSKIIVLFIILFALQSCRKQELIEVVDVPLPSSDEKIVIGDPKDVKAISGTFEMYKLPFKYDELNPNFDALTLETHYAKIYLNFTNNLNKIVANTDLAELSIEEILSKLELKNDSLRTNAGGFYNHKIYFETIGVKTPRMPKDTLAGAIIKDFGSFDQFSSEFKEKAEKQIGSGWTWLVLDKQGILQITNSLNNDNPLMRNAEIKGTPLFAIDNWEHAYFLNYQNKKRKYIDAFFSSINWIEVERKFEEKVK
jgi:superoxide dismutase, Fe-Mn family